MLKEPSYTFIGVQDQIPTQRQQNGWDHLKVSELTEKTVSQPLDDGQSFMENDTCKTQS